MVLLHAMTHFNCQAIKRGTHSAQTPTYKPSFHLKQELSCKNYHCCPKYLIYCSQTFERINLREFNAITQPLETNVSNSKLSILFIKLSKLLHKMSLTKITHLPSNETLIHPLVKTGIKLKSPSGDFITTPDIVLLPSYQLASANQPFPIQPVEAFLQKDPQIVFISECASFQSKEVLVKKLQCKVNAHPEIIMTSMIILMETTLYCSPKESSTTWQTFCCYSKCISFLEFMKMMPGKDGDSEAFHPYHFPLSFVTITIISNLQTTTLLYYFYT
ncbi:hypothetical protein HD554DRAFT_2039913 [Boletus coccyginus]|nr:hypothetical protein HD554DRAFT_2039913 [Boletus coccyginus]